MAEKQGQISSELQVLGRRLKEFREVHPPRTRLPEELWTAATSLASQEGLYHTARTLQLDYASLKRRVETSSKRRISSKRSATTPRRTDTRKKSVPTAFVELLGESIASVGSRAADCLIEVEGASGARLRIRMRMSTPEVVSLVRDWQCQAAERGHEVEG
jgi:hypothetical protein